MSDTGPLLQTKGLVKVYKGGGVPVTALQGVDLRVAAGEWVAVMGPSGSGKSTLLHVVAGLDARTSGEIWLDGERIDTLRERAMALIRRRRIGLMFQFFNLVENMTVADNVELPAMLAGASPAKARERRKELLGDLGLSDRTEFSPAELSGGQQQRVALARALANQPDLLLADEPTGNLDSGSARDVLRLLQRVHKNGQSVLLVTHDAKVASMADRVVTLLDGEIVDDGEVKQAPPSGRGAGTVVELKG